MLQPLSSFLKANKKNTKKNVVSSESFDDLRLAESLKKYKEET